MATNQKQSLKEDLKTSETDILESNTGTFWEEVAKFGGRYVQSQKDIALAAKQIRIKNGAGVPVKPRKQPNKAPDSSQLWSLTRQCMVSQRTQKYELAMLSLEQPNMQQPAFRNLLSLVGRIEPNQERSLLIKILQHKRITRETLYDLENLPRFSHPEIAELMKKKLGKLNIDQMRKGIEKIPELAPGDLGNMLMSRPNRNISPHRPQRNSVKETVGR